MTLSPHSAGLVGSPCSIKSSWKPGCCGCGVWLCPQNEAPKVTPVIISNQCRGNRQRPELMLHVNQGIQELHTLFPVLFHWCAWSHDYMSLQRMLESVVWAEQPGRRKMDWEAKADCTIIIYQFNYLSTNMFINLLIVIINIMLLLISIQLKTQLQSQSCWFPHLSPPFNNW